MSHSPSAPTTTFGTRVGLKPEPVIVISYPPLDPTLGVTENTAKYIYPINEFE